MNGERNQTARPIHEQKVRAAIVRAGHTDPPFINIVAPWIEGGLSSRLGEWYVADITHARFTMRNLDHMSFSCRAIVYFGEEFMDTAVVPYRWKLRGRRYEATFELKKARPRRKG